MSCPTPPMLADLSLPAPPTFTPEMLTKQIEPGKPEPQPSILCLCLAVLELGAGPTCPPPMRRNGPPSRTRHPPVPRMRREAGAAVGGGLAVLVLAFG